MSLILALCLVFTTSLDKLVPYVDAGATLDTYSFPHFLGEVGPLYGGDFAKNHLETRTKNVRYVGVRDVHKHAYTLLFAHYRETIA